MSEIKEKEAAPAPPTGINKLIIDEFSCVILYLFETRWTVYFRE